MTPNNPLLCFFVCNPSFSFRSEHCVPSPGLGPLSGPLFGGLSGSSILIGQQAATLRLAQLKSQLALTHLTSTLAVGNQTAAFKTNSKVPVPYICSPPPSPTAAAINLLNLLKIINNMSRPPYNPCASGNPNSTQRQYGFLSAHTGKEPQTPSLHLQPGSSFASSGGIRPSLMPHTLGYRPEGVRTEMDEDIGRTVDLHISRAREEVRGLSKPMQHNTGHGSGFTSKPRDDFCSSDTGTTYSASSSLTSTGHRHSDLQSGRSSLDWLNKYDKLSSDSPKSFSSSASSNRGERDLQYIPGLGDFGKRAPHPETDQSEHTTETALNILRQHGLEKEDLEHLISYPEDQMTPDNLPYILRQIRIHKAKRTATAGQPKPFPDHKPSASVSGMSSQSSNTPGLSAPSQKGMSSTGLQPRKVIDYGHTSKFHGGVVDETKTTSVPGSSGSVLLMDTSDKSRLSQEQLCKDTKKTKSPASGSSVDQTREKSQRKPETSKSSALKGPRANTQSVLKAQPPSCTPLHVVHPDRPGLVLIQRNDDSGNRDKCKMKSQESPLAERTKKYQMQRQPAGQHSKQQTQKEVASNMAQGAWPPVFSAATPRLSAAPIPSITSVSQTLHHPAFSPNPIGHPPATHQLPPAPVNFDNTTMPNSQGKISVSKGLPTSVMIHDYTATTPRFFPHTCSLCVKDCFQLQVSGRTHSRVVCLLKGSRVANPELIIFVCDIYWMKNSCFFKCLII